MSIVSSLIVSDDAQRDGRRWIRERHTDQLGVAYERSYLVPAVFDANAALAAYAVILAADITAREIARNVADITANGSLASPTLNYSTMAANFSALRVAYQTATRVDAIMIGDFLNTLSSAQLQAAFGLTAGQVTTLRANKLQPAADLATSIRATTGQ